MSEVFQNKILKELNDPLTLKGEHFEKCLLQADGNMDRAKKYYLHQRLAEETELDGQEDDREKWPMLVPLLTLYTLGTIGVLALVYGYLARRLDWW